MLVPVPFPAPQFQEITTERRFPRLKLSHRCPLFHSGSAARGSGLRHAVPARRSLHPTTPRRRSSIRFTPHSTARKQNHSQPPRAIVSGTIGTRLSPRVLCAIRKPSNPHFGVGRWEESPAEGSSTRSSRKLELRMPPAEPGNGAAGYTRAFSHRSEEEKRDRAPNLTPA